jgi:hypothetical protein
MKLYITRSPREKLKKAFLNMRKQHVISVSEIIEQMGYGEQELDSYTSFLVNEEIKNQIRAVSRARRAHSIIYCNPNLNEDIIRFIIFYVNESTDIESVYFLTEENKDENYFELFDGVTFFPSMKKIHIVDCRTADNSLLKWIDELPDEC